jgi:hypothetical protein
MSIFNETKYTKWYFDLINTRKDLERTCFTENHHIIPKSLGGDNFDSNIVKLTPREHFICHHLLLKMVDDEKNKRSMCYAFYMMKKLNKENESRCNSRKYDRIKKKYSYLTSGENNPFYGKGHFGDDNPMAKIENKKRHLDAVRSPEYRRMQSINSTGKNNPFYGKKHTEESKLKIAIKASQRCGELSPRWGSKHRIVVCEFCEKEIAYPMYRRWHGENCKVNKKG